MKDSKPLTVPLQGEGNAGYALNQTGVPPNSQQPLLQMPPAVPTQQTAQLQTGQQAQVLYTMYR